MNSRTRRILIVDDNEAIHADFRRILTPEKKATESLDAKESALFGDSPADDTVSGFELDFAFQGQEALTMVCRAWNENRPYMMAFMDVRMPPGWDGIETTSRIWEVDPYLQVVICTAYSDYSWKQVAAQLSQPDRFVILKKPFDVMEVLQLANAFTEKWHLLRQVEERALKLQESEKRYQVLADAVPGLVWTAQPDGKVDYVNKRLNDYTGKPFSQGNGWGWQEILHPEDVQNSVERWNGAVQSGEPYQMEHRVKRASDGTYRRHLSRAVPMRNHKGEIIHWVGIAIDIEDQRKS